MKALLLFFILITSLTRGGSLRAEPVLSHVVPSVSARVALNLAEQYVAEKHFDLKDNFLNKVEFVESGEFARSADGSVRPCWVLTFDNKDKIKMGGQLYVRIFMDHTVDHRWGF